MDQSQYPEQIIQSIIWTIHQCSANPHSKKCSQFLPKSTNPTDLSDDYFILWSIGKKRNSELNSFYGIHTTEQEELLKYINDLHLRKIENCKKYSEVYNVHSRFSQIFCHYSRVLNYQRFLKRFPSTVLYLAKKQINGDCSSS